MGINEIVTKEDLAVFESRLLEKISEIVKSSGKKRTLSLEEACEYLGKMNPKTLRQKASTFEIASHKNGKRLAFDTDDLDAYLAKTRRMSSDELARLARI